MAKIKVFVVDDSLFMRKFISDMLNADPEIEVIETAIHGEDALKKLARIKPDVITLDVIMPVMGGLRTLKKIMAENPIPVIMLSAYTKENADITIKCLDEGAVGFVLKPSGTVSFDIEKIKEELLQKIKVAGKVSIEKLKRLLKKKPVPKKFRPKAVLFGQVIAIGASTGGPKALEIILSELPSNFHVPILIVQHMPPKFTQSFAERLNEICSIEVKEAKEGDVVISGTAYIAPGDYHMIVEKKIVSGRERIVIGLNKKSPVHGLRPSVDVMMKSVAEIYGANAIGVILTGMGSDGVEGMRAIKERGGRTIAQDEASSLIFGMPERVIESGDADKILPLTKISQGVIELI